MTRSWIAFIVVRQHRALAKVAVARKLAVKLF
jgi:hypothetical protein